MSEQEQSSQLSALFDGELPPEQAELVIRRALKDPGMRGRWERYALIGACVRQEPLRVHAGDVGIADRVRARLVAEPEHGEAAQVIPLQRPAAASVPVRRSLVGRGLLGGAIAAGVAVLSIFVVRGVGPVDPVAAGLVAQTQVPATGIDAGADTLPSYTTPVGNTRAPQVGGQMLNYLVAHSEVAASAVRFSPLPAVVSEGYEVADAPVDGVPADGSRR